MTTPTKPVAEIVAEDSMDQDDSDEYLPLPPEGHPLRTLGVRLTELLDEDHWAECERLLLEGWDHDRIDRKTGADWRENSSLELWFPLTAAELTRLSGDIESIKTHGAFLCKECDDATAIVVHSVSGTQWNGFDVDVEVFRCLRCGNEWSD